MKLIISTAIIAIAITLIMTQPSVFALTDTEKEAGIARDAQGRICDFGLHHDECPNTSNTMPPGSKADDGVDVSGFPILPPGQHYAGCEEDIHHELGCDVVNDTSSPTIQAFKGIAKDGYDAGYKIGYTDGVAGERFHHLKIENATVSFSDGYSDGWNKGMVEWGTTHGLKDPQENADLLADVSSP